MPITVPLKEWYFKTTPGMNNKSDVLELNGKWVSNAINCRYEDEPGAVSKRPPLSYFNSSEIPGSGPILGLYRYYGSVNVKSVCVRGDTVYVGDDVAGTWTAIRTLGSSTARMAFVTYQDLMIACNGVDSPFVYDGSSDNVTWDLGSCKALTGSGTGITKNSVSYKVTIDNDAYVCGAVSNEISALTNEDVDLTNIPLGPAGTVNRKIYRKDDTTGGTWRLVTTISNNTATTYNDTTASVSGAAAIPIDTDTVPIGDILNIYRERLFISGDPVSPSRIYFSNPYLPHFIQHVTNVDRLDVATDDGETITGLAIQLGTMACWKHNTIRKLHITSPTSGADPATWFAEDPISFVGSAAKWSITQTPYGVMFLGWDRWYIFDGSNVRELIGEFDIKQIQSARFDETICHYSKGHFYAAYTDITIGNQFHDRLLVYNMNRNKFALDTIKVNCFASYEGQDETGELFFGSSDSGFVYKSEESENSYKLRSKTEANEGTLTDTFVGGTEANAYIEIGSNVNPSSIPDDICIFWEDDTSNPGSGWTEVVSNNNLIKVSTTAGTTAGTSAHTHAMSGQLLQSTAQDQDGGDSEGTSTDNNHGHNVSGTSASSGEVYPRRMKLRVFKKNSSTTETEFPTGAIIMYDQGSAPEGWRLWGEDGHYIQMQQADLGEAISSSHSHTFSLTSGTGGDCIDSGFNTQPNLHSPCNHTHGVSGTTSTTTLDTWELDYAGFTFIKKIGDSGSWDGTDKYAYALYDSAGTPGNGWSDVSSTYDTMYLKVLTGTISTGSAANSVHTHTISDGISDYHSGLGPGYGGYHHQMIERHNHPYQLTASNCTAITACTHRTFRIFKKVLGHMKVYNDALTNHQGTGTWTSPAIQIDAETFDTISWNGTKGSSDTITFHTRTGASEAACTAAAWSTGITISGSQIASTPDVWFQYKIEFTAVDTTTSNPQVFYSGGSLVEVLYIKRATTAETSIPFTYETGNLNFDAPLIDKVFKKIQTSHDSDGGSMTVYWETENASGTFTVDLSTYPERWDTFFQDNAMGQVINIRITKDDLNTLTLKEFKGLYSPQPVEV